MYPGSCSVVSTYGVSLPIRCITLAGEQEIDFKLLNRIIILFDKEKPHKRHCVDIRKIASMVLSNKSYTSAVINTCFNTNFNQFVNFYRVKDALYHIENNNNTPVTVLCEDIGFRSFSAFSDAFKRYTRGYTPYNWQQNVDMMRMQADDCKSVKEEEDDGYDKVV